MKDPVQLRQKKGQDNPSSRGEGSVYLIPASDMPEGDFSGEEVKMIIQGLMNTDEQGGVIDVKRITIERVVRDRSNPLQSSIEKSLSEDDEKNEDK